MPLSTDRQPEQWLAGRRQLTEHLDEEVYRFEIRQLVVVGVDAHAKEEASVAPVDKLVVPELDGRASTWVVRGTTTPPAVH